MVKRDEAAGPVWPWWVLMLFASTWGYLETWHHARRTNESTLPLAPSHLLAWSSISLAVGVTILFLCWASRPGRRCVDRCLAAGLTGILTFQSWRVVTRIVDIVDQHAGRFGAIALGATLVGGVLVLAFRVADEPSLPWFFFILVSALVGPPLLGAAAHGISLVLHGVDSLNHAQAMTVATGPDKRDLFVVIVDGYGREDVLRDQFDIDSTSFHERLTASGFQVVGSATANYPHTWASLGSVLSLDYPIQPGPVPPDNSERFQRLLAGDNPLFATAHLLGYEIVQLDNSWTFSRCGEFVGRCVPSTWMTSLDYAVMSRTPLGNVFPELRVNPWVAGSIQQLSNLKDELAIESDVPRLVYAHALIPHPPFLAQDDCSTLHQSSLDGYESLETGDDLDTRVAGYAAQIGCVNRLVAEFGTALPESAVAIITADHGSQFRQQLRRPISTWEPADYLERYGIFLALHLPDGCGRPPEDISLVNATRLAVQCAFDSEYVPIQSRHFLVPHLENGAREVVEITSVIKDLHAR